MSGLVQLQPAYIIHRRDYRNTSYLIELLTQEYGRVSVVAKAAKRSKSQILQYCQPFLPVACSWVGRGDLKTLTNIEAWEPSLNVSNKKIVVGHRPVAGIWGLPKELIWSGLYINELIMRLVKTHDVLPILFDHYHQTLQRLFALGDKNSLPNDVKTDEARLIDRFKLEVFLREFEKVLLSELGYGIDFSVESRTGRAVVQSREYCFEPERGLFAVDIADLPRFNKAEIFNGESLLAIGRGDYGAADALSSAKRIMRQVLQLYLGAEPLKVRQFVVESKNIVMKAVSNQNEAAEDSVMAH